MARTVNRLSARTVSTTTERGRYPDGAGLYLYVDDSGSKRWVLIFQWRGKRTEMGLGSAAPNTGVSLGEARKKAAEARKLVEAGKNPIEERKRAQSAAQGATFGDAAAELIESLRPSWKSKKHGDQWKKTFYGTEKGPGYAASLMDRPVAMVSTDDVLEVLKPLWLAKPETAGKVRGRVERVLDAAKAKGLRAGENPARWRGHLDHLLPKRPKLVRGHQRAIPYDQAPAVMERLRVQKLRSAKALAFTVLTAVRENESLGARRREFDFEARIWSIPSERMKGTNPPPHRVPLSEPAIEIVKEMIGEDDIDPDALIFPGAKAGKPLSDAAMDRLLQRMGVDATPHGFRSTFRDWAGDCTTFPRELAEEALAHIVGDETERAYRRTDALEKRRKLMEAWARFLSPEEDVVEFRRRSS